MTQNPPTSTLTPVQLAKKRKRPLRERSPILAHVRANLFKGLITAIPLFITLYIINVSYGLITTYTQDPANWIVDRLFTSNRSGIATLKTLMGYALALLISLFVVYILGLLGTFFIGRQILAQADHFIENLPLIKGIYGTTKQVISVFRQGGGGQGFQRVVLVEFPRQGTWTIAFVTNTVHDPGIPPPHRLVCCFIPMTPNPTSGFFQMFPEDQVRNTEWTIDMGLKIVLSGGLLAPHDLHGPPASLTAPHPPLVPPSLPNLPPSTPATPPS